jgi:hypothetical protein
MNRGIESGSNEGGKKQIVIELIIRLAGFFYKAV